MREVRVGHKVGRSEHHGKAHVTPHETVRTRFDPAPDQGLIQVKAGVAFSGQAEDLVR